MRARRNEGRVWGLSLLIGVYSCSSPLAMSQGSTCPMRDQRVLKNSSVTPYSDRYDEGDGLAPNKRSVENARMYV